MDGHASAFWEVSLNASFTNIVASKYVISGDLLTLDLSTLDAPLVKATEYWIRARFTSVSGTQSQHSSPIRIVTVYPSPAIAGRLTGPFAEDVGVAAETADAPPPPAANAALNLDLGVGEVEEGGDRCA